MSAQLLCRSLFAGCVGLTVFLDNRTAAAPAPDPLGWPEIRREARPWTRWWWPGSAVTPDGVNRQLELFAAAGLGGVEITPIYGAQGAESRSLEFLSQPWVAILIDTARQARRLGLGVDMVTGTGWPFGGPWISLGDGSQKIVLKNGRLAGEPTGMKVKRAAPGGEGLVIDPFSIDAIQHYLEPFSRALAELPPGLVRGQFHDSFEYYGAEWSPLLPGNFQREHGYDLQAHAAALLDSVVPPTADIGRLKSDYRETLAQMHLAYLREWVRWSHAHGFLARNQSHGAPANLLDLYGTVDIPETETFGSTPFPIFGLRREAPDIDLRQDAPEPLVMRMASSAAHVMGRPYASSETCTWLREHWKEALAFTKPEIDQLFVNGINHIFYHGTVYSPPDAPWPGWLFYASTQFNPNNTWWDDFSALNHYVARVQSVLQGGKPDNDVLLYWPFADVVDDPHGLVQQLGVHHAGWLTASPFGAIARALTRAGYGCDYISDAQLQDTTVDSGNLVTSGGTRFRILIVPAVRRLPVETLRQILALARAGAAVQVVAPPEDVPGLGNLEERRRVFQQLCGEMRGLAGTRDSTLRLGTENQTETLDKLFLAAHASREAMADAGLGFIRRKTATGWDYFIVNQTAQTFAGWIPLGTPAAVAVLLDPRSDRLGRAALRRSGDHPAEIFLQLASDESVIVRTSSLDAAADSRPPWRYVAPAGPELSLRDNWKIEFIKGGPELPAPHGSVALGSWTELGGAEVERFAGTARYTLAISVSPESADDWLLDLGDVRESARVRINGREAGVAWSLPFRLRIGQFLHSGRNVLEIEVTNLAANRIRDLDRRKVPWKIMREINFVNIQYQAFDASDWGLAPSGLLGPVTLVPLKLLHPE